MLFEILCKCLVNLVQEQVLRIRSSREDDSRIPNNPGIRFIECLQQQVVFLQDVRLIQQESWFDIGFIFLDSC